MVVRISSSWLLGRSALQRRRRLAHLRPPFDGRRQTVPSVRQLLDIRVSRACSEVIPEKNCAKAQTKPTLYHATPTRLDGGAPHLDYVQSLAWSYWLLTTR